MRRGPSPTEWSLRRPRRKAVGRRPLSPLLSARAVVDASALKESSCRGCTEAGNSRLRTCLPGGWIVVSWLKHVVWIGRDRV